MGSRFGGGEAACEHLIEELRARVQQEFEWEEFGAGAAIDHIITQLQEPRKSLWLADLLGRRLGGRRCSSFAENVKQKALACPGGVAGIGYRVKAVGLLGRFESIAT